MGALYLIFMILGCYTAPAFQIGRVFGVFADEKRKLL